MKDITDAMLDELTRVLGAIDDRPLADIAAAVLNREQVFVAGAGRSGLMVRAFAMRLMHMGVSAHVVGETVTPNITDRDLLIIGSGSGSTASLRVMAERAADLGASIALITIDPQSPIAARADFVVTIPAPSPKAARADGFKSVQPMGSLFEQSLLLVLDALIMLLMKMKGNDAATMFTRHANLE